MLLLLLLLLLKKPNISGVMTGYKLTILRLNLTITITSKNHRLSPASDQSELRQVLDALEY